MQITDSLTLDASGLTLTRDGYLAGEAKVSRAGNVQQYMGHELGLTGDKANKVFGVYRDPDVVFDEASMMSLAGRPVTRGHPSGLVDASNWKELAIGQVGGTIKRDGEHVVAPMAIMDARSAKEVADGARSLSAGYTVGVTADEGVSLDGTPYQFRQVGPLRFNHVAYLPDNNPRAGNTRIGDGAFSWGIAPTPSNDGLKGRSMTNRTITIDGLPVDLADKDAQIVQRTIDKLTADAETAVKALADAKAEHDKALAAKDTEIGTKDAKIKELEGKVLDAAAVDKLVKDRGDLIATAKAIVSDVAVDGVADADIKKAVVQAKCGDEAVKDRSEAYIDARFDALAETIKTNDADPFRDTLKGGIKTADNDLWGDSVFSAAGVSMKKGA